MLPYIFIGTLVFLIVFICIAHFGSEVEKKITKIMDK